MLTRAEIHPRKPVWVALSELWLDTEMRATSRVIAHRLAESGLSIAELRRIYLFEVAPAVWPNLTGIIGVWDGFDDQWLCDRIQRNLIEHPVRTNFMSCFPLTRRLMTSATEETWVRLVKLIRENRGSE